MCHQHDGCCQTRSQFFIIGMVGFVRSVRGLFRGVQIAQSFLRLFRRLFLRLLKRLLRRLFRGSLRGLLQGQVLRWRRRNTGSSVFWRHEKGVRFRYEWEFVILSKLEGVRAAE